MLALGIEFAKSFAFFFGNCHDVLLHIQSSPFDYEKNIPHHLRYYKVDVTLESDAGFGVRYLIILGISAIVSGNDIVVVFVGTVANFTDLN